MTKKRPARGQHLVPRFYLRGFSDQQNPEKIWVYRLPSRTGQPIRPIEPSLERIENVCVERDRFAVTGPTGRLALDSVERELAHLESLANPVLTQLRQGKVISFRGKRALARYMIMMHLRTRRSHGRRLEVAQKAAREMDWDAIVRSAGYAGEFDRALDVINNQARYQEEAARNVVSMGTLLSMESAEAYLCAMRWRFLKSASEMFFVTSDTPVVLGEGFGLKHSQATVLFPISSDLALWASWEGTEDLTIDQATENETYLMNSFRIRHAYKEVYARESAKWISSELEMQAAERARMERPGA